MSETQFDDFLAEMDATNAPKSKPRPVAPAKPDPVGDNLVQNGLVPSIFILDLNHGLTIPSDLERPYPWGLPSRLFIFPIEVTHQAADGSRKIGLLHPLLAEHPFVQRLSVLGIECDPNGAPNEFGYSKVRTGSWWHAVDLISSGHWQDLLKTARFTTPEDIAGAVSYGLQYSPHEGKKRTGHISTAQAREIMAFLGSDEPSNRETVNREHFMPPSPQKSEKGTERCPINRKGEDALAAVWLTIIGIERGYFAHDRAGFLQWTERGQKLFPAQEQTTPPTPQPPREPEPLASLAESIAPRPGIKPKSQLDLF